MRGARASSHAHCTVLSGGGSSGKLKSDRWRRAAPGVTTGATGVTRGGVTAVPAAVAGITAAGEMPRGAAAGATAATAGILAAAGLTAAGSTSAVVLGAPAAPVTAARASAASVSSPTAATTPAALTGSTRADDATAAAVTAAEAGVRVAGGCSSPSSVTVSSMMTCSVPYPGGTTRLRLAHKSARHARHMWRRNTDAHAAARQPHTPRALHPRLRAPPNAREPGKCHVAVPLAVEPVLNALSAVIFPSQSAAAPVRYHGTASAGPRPYTPLHVAATRALVAAE